MQGGPRVLEIFLNNEKWRHICASNPIFVATRIILVTTPIFFRGFGILFFLGGVRVAFFYYHSFTTQKKFFPFAPGWTRAFGVVYTFSRHKFNLLSGKWGVSPQQRFHCHPTWVTSLLIVLQIIKLCKSILQNLHLQYAPMSLGVSFELLLAF